MAKTGPKVRTTEKFIEDAKIVHGNVYDYSLVNYTGLDNKVIFICREHGEYTQTPHQHLRGRHCPLCANKNNALSRALSQEEYIARAIEVHGTKYDYSKVVYTGGQHKITIICPIHGEFKQKPENHTNAKQGCLKCYHDSRKGKGGGGYALEYFGRHPEKRVVPGTLYIARMQHKNDDFIKVGITATGGVKERFYYKAMHGTVITPLFEISLKLYDAFQKEQELLEKLAPYRYFPNRKFAGYTECFKNNDQVMTLVKEFLG